MYGYEEQTSNTQNCKTHHHAWSIDGDDKDYNNDCDVYHDDDVHDDENVLDDDDQDKEDNDVRHYLMKLRQQLLVGDEGQVAWKITWDISFLLLYIKIYINESITYYIS